MALKPPPAKQYPILDEGVYVGVCTVIADIGTHRVGGQYPGDKRLVFIEFEIPDERRDDGKPHKLAMNLPFSLGNKAALRKLIKSWRNKDYTDAELKNGPDIGQLIGKPAQVQVIHNASGGKMYANIGGLMAMPKGMPAPSIESDLIEFGIDGADAIPSNLPPYIQEKIRNSVEWRDRGTGSSGMGGPSAPIDKDFDEFADRVNGSAWGDQAPDSDDIPFE